MLFHLLLDSFDGLKIKEYSSCLKEHGLVELEMLNS